MHRVADPVWSPIDLDNSDDACHRSEAAQRGSYDLLLNASALPYPGA